MVPTGEVDVGALGAQPVAGHGGRARLEHPVVIRVPVAAVAAAATAPASEAGRRQSLEGETDVGNGGRYFEIYGGHTLTVRKTQISKGKSRKFSFILLFKYSRKPEAVRFERYRVDKRRGCANVNGQVRYLPSPLWDVPRAKSIRAEDSGSVLGVDELTRKKEELHIPD